MLELPGELRNQIYEYVANHERYLQIKPKLRPKKKLHIAARHGLVLANRQILDEYIGIVQDVAAETDITLVARVHDFNFRHLEKYLSTIRNYSPRDENDGKLVHVDLIINECNHFDTESFASWVSEDNRTGFCWTYSVDDAFSGHRFLMPPPRHGDMLRFEQAAQTSSSAQQIYMALRRWLERCWGVYLLRHNDPSKDKLMRWRQWDRSTGGPYYAGDYVDG